MKSTHEILTETATELDEIQALIQCGKVDAGAFRLKAAIRRVRAMAREYEAFSKDMGAAARNHVKQLMLGQKEP